MKRLRLLLRCERKGEERGRKIINEERWNGRGEQDDSQLTEKPD